MSGIVFLLLALCSVYSAELDWSGYKWKVKNTPKAGHGPNMWSENNVKIDQKGHLHLYINYDVIKKNWVCSQIISKSNYKYGKFEWVVEGPLQSFDPSIVLGLFLYAPSNSTPTMTNQIDIEMSMWGNIFNKNRLSYTLWPKEKTQVKKSKSFPLNLKTNITTHRFTWNSTSVIYQSFYGQSTNKKNQLHSWNVSDRTGQLIPAKQLNPRINLWLLRGKGPRNNKPVEVVVRSFKRYDL